MANKNYVNPYSDLAQYLKDGFDYVVTNFTSGDTEEDLVTYVYDYMVTVFPDILTNVDSQILVKSVIANAINGYLNYGEGINPELRSEPVQFLASYFERIEESMNTASAVVSSQSNNQITISYGKAAYEYWKNAVDNSASSPWTAYLTGNVATDLNDIPYWITAAMFGSRYSFNQVNNSTVDALGATSITTLAGALVVGAGKVLFRWVPKKKW